MNLNLLVPEFSQDREQDKQWVPLITQQLRLRHVNHIQAFNLQSEGKGTFYFTLHKNSTDPSFYVSQKSNVKNPKWSEIYLKEENGALSAVVMRIWQACEAEDEVILTWGVNFSGLVHLGNKIADIHPYYFKSNTVIFFMQNAYFTSQDCLRMDTNRTLPFQKHLNLLDNKILYRRIAVKEQNVQPSYSLDKLKKLQNLQLRIKTKKQEVQHVKDRIRHATLNDIASVEPQTESNYSNNIRFAPQLLTMTCLNKMLHEKPTQSQKDEMERKAKEIEKIKFKIRMLEQEKERKNVLLGQLRKKKEKLEESNEERNCDLMSRYHMLQKDFERLKDYKKLLLQHKEMYCHVNMQLNHRQKQLLKELLFIYPIEKTDGGKYTILGVHLPNSDVLAECTDTGLPIALGYVTHALVMSSILLQVPLRYPMSHLGSRSVITDQVSSLLPDREREFPLFTRGKEKVQFTYAVYLLNKNLAQLRWLIHLHTTDLKATLPNLLQFLQGSRDHRPHTPVLSSLSCFVYDSHSRPTDSGFSLDKWTSLSTIGPVSSLNDSLLDSIKQERTHRTKSEPTCTAKTCKSRHCGRSLSAILAIPEAYLNKQITQDVFEKYVSSRQYNLPADKNDDSCDSECSYKTIKIKRGTEEPRRSRFDSTKSDSIEQGTDPLDPNVDLSSVITKSIAIRSENRQTSTKRSLNLDVLQNRRLSRSVGSYSDTENDSLLRESGFFNNPSMEMGSDPLICATRDSTQNSSSEINVAQQELLEKWLESGADLITNDEYLNASLNDLSSPLTARTDRLMSVTSFNLVRPKM